MKLFYLIFLSLSILSTESIFAQKIKIKKNTVIIDGIECLKISGDSNNVTFSNLEGKELFFLKYFHNSKHAPIYDKVIFLDQEVSLTSSEYIFTKKLLIKKLTEEKVLSGCEFNSERINRFILKYDENVEGN